MSDSTPRDPEASSAVKRMLPFFLLVLAAGGFLFWFFSDAQVIGRAINGLHSDSPETRKEHLKVLADHPNRSLVNELLLAAVHDDDLAWTVRRFCVLELVERERLPDLDNILRTGSRDACTVVIDALRKKDYFESTYVNDPAYRVRDTVKAWVAGEVNTKLVTAIQIARQLKWLNAEEKILWKEIIDLIRPRLTREGNPNVRGERLVRVLQASIGAVRDFKDCPSLPAIMKLAQSDPAVKVRRAALQAVHFLGFARAECTGEVTEEQMTAVLDQAMGADEKTLRMAALLILKEQDAWTHARIDTLRGTLTSDRDAPERRLALELLIGINHEETLKELPRWMHDRHASLRSSAAQSVSRFPPKENPYLGSLISILRNEQLQEGNPHSLAYETAIRQLKDAAGTWQGVPEKMANAAVGREGRAKFQQHLLSWLRNETVEGITRKDFARGWFRWLAKHLGVGDEDLDAAVKVYDDFWKAADARDTAAAKQALSGNRFEKDALFAFARGWLQAQQ